MSVSDARIPLDAASNTAALGAAQVLRRLGREQDGVELVIEKGLPLSGGLGGSAASAVAGAFATHALCGGCLSEAELLHAAIEAEAVVAGRHADNAAPSLLGGAVVVLGAEPLRYVRVGVHASLRLVFVTPGYGVLTAHARSVLPESVARARGGGAGGGARGPRARPRARRRRPDRGRDGRPHRRAAADPALSRLRVARARRRSRPGPSAWP